VSSADTLQLLPRIRAALLGSAPMRETRNALFAGAPPEYSARIWRFAPANPLRAAVLIAISDAGEDAGILLTQRAEDLKTHGGQVSFPGGRCDPDDEDPTLTALRESEEEIGLARDRVEVIGYLPDHLVISGYQVTPVVAVVGPGFQPKPHPGEVADVFTIPLGVVFDPQNHRTRTRNFPDGDVEIYDLSFGSRNVWGATAGMLMTLYRTVLEATRA
jgi:8-oxo-dGTP pyrophosphatase MutT (NUDIX family)